MTAPAAFVTSPDTREPAREQASRPRREIMALAQSRTPRPWPNYMTARTAAHYCGTSPWTIRRHLRPCGRRGRVYVYALDEVERWMRGSPLPGAEVQP